MDIGKEVASLKRLGAKALRRRYAEAFGESTNSGNKVWLVKRIVWRLQANAEGDIREWSQSRAKELANDADLRVGAPKKSPVIAETLAAADSRLPPPGTILVRHYRGKDIRVKVLVEGFECNGTTYRTLSAAAKAVTGSHVNGFAFFKLTKGAKR